MSNMNKGLCEKIVDYEFYSKLREERIFSGIFFFYCDGNNYYVMYSIMNILSFVYELNDANLKRRYFEEQTHFF